MATDTLERPHFDLYRSESAALVPDSWELWLAELEALIGHSADGDQTEDHYSLDGFYQLWREGSTPSEASKEIENIEFSAMHP